MMFGMHACRIFLFGKNSGNAEDSLVKFISPLCVEAESSAFKEFGLLVT